MYLVKESSRTGPEDHHVLVLRLITDELGDTGSLKRCHWEAVIDYLAPICIIPPWSTTVAVKLFLTTF